MESFIVYICLTGMFLPFVILFYNKGYLTANRYLAGFLFFAAFYLLENFFFFYGKSLWGIAFFTTTHAFFYLIGPFSYFYVRSILNDNTKISKRDFLHYALFIVSFLGYLPYFFSSWEHKLTIAQNIYSENWDMAQFHINAILPHKVDQFLNLLQTYFYAISLWYLLWYHKKVANNPIINNDQFKLIRNWILIFICLITVITLNFTIAMVNMWIFDDKSVFLSRASFALLFAAVIYVGMNMMVMIFPNIMYGLPLENQYQPIAIDSTTVMPPVEGNYTIAPIDISLKQKKDLELFSSEYIEKIEAMLQDFIGMQLYSEVDCSLSQISDKLRIPAHHLTYYFNNIKKESFSDWRNQLRIEYATRILKQGKSSQLTLEAIGLKVGFKSNSTFIRCFKKYIGQTPSEFAETNC
ncbi:MAG: helix-turn-helix domain-containing protein [Bacteroidota bacterium]